MKLQTYQVNEIFHSIQGEGVHMGAPATFVRLQGCTVGCVWCDTKYTWMRGGTRMNSDEIADQIKYRHVVITGGEPTMYDLDNLIIMLRNPKWRFIQLETSGQQWLKGRERPAWITWSPKQNLDWDAPEEFYLYAHEIKYVVDDALTWDIIHDRFSKLSLIRLADKPVVSLMPEGCPPRQEMVNKALEFIDRAFERGWQFRYSDRLQWRIGVK